MIAIVATPAAAQPVDFNRDIRPIFSNNCFTCHGPDSKFRQANLRLDLLDDAFTERRPGLAPIVPGDPDASLLIRRITSDDPGYRMPPPESKKSLTEAEKAILARWIAAGAAWEPHWSFVTPKSVEPPQTRDPWPRNGIDRFVLPRLAAAGLAPSPPAERETLIRRVSFDLAGLPPTLQEIDAFLADGSAGAYEKVVDRLLASTAYGERMAMAWLDLARYADTNGYHYDNERTMWPWRDWVIDAYNRNLPFDRFTVEQLAGDLLPEPDLAQRIATGFNRNHGISWEGGIIPEEYQLEYVVDRVGTTATAWMGLTMGCARCHDHKFDPITQKEFYRFAAFFNTISEQGADGLEGNAVPNIATPGADDVKKIDVLDQAIAALQKQYDTPDPEQDAAFARWSRQTAAVWRAAWTVLDPFAFKSAGGAELVKQEDGSLFAQGRHPDSEVYEIVAFSSVPVIRAIRLEAMADQRLPRGGPGRASHANIVLSEFEVEVAPVTAPNRMQPVVFVTAHADHSQRGFHVTRAIDGKRETGWALNDARFGEDRVAIFVPREPFGFEGGTVLRVRIRQDSDFMQHAIGRVRLAVTGDETMHGALQPSELGPWHVIGPFPADSPAAARETAFGPESSLGHGVDLDASWGDDGSLRWRQRPEFEDGVVHGLTEVDNAATYLYRVVTTPDTRMMTMSFGSDDALKVWVNGELILDADAPRPAAADQDIVTAELRAGVNDLLIKITNYGGEHAFYFDRREDHALDPPLDVLAKLNRPEAERNDEQQRELRDHYLSEHSPAARQLLAALAAKRSEHAALMEGIPTVMVMDEMAEPRKTFVLTRGRYDQPADEVEPGVPSVLAGFASDVGPTRLGLARWLTDPEHPLTARVAVNRYWQMHFGRGLVTTPEDFGTQGSPPTHPRLLDWLACEFVRSGWDVKAMHRLIVTSATYRQATPASAERRVIDPDNRLLARGARFRLPAEMIRDAALRAAGLLVEKVGGPPVKPYQPEGLWKEIGSDFAAFSANVYQRDTGAALYRRTMYTFWKRTLPPPALVIFDAPSREFCIARRSRTNTPLQALVVLNDPTYVEAARFLAQRMLTEADDETGNEASDRHRAALGFRIATSRAPTEAELNVLVGLYERQYAAFSGDPDAVRGLLGVGEAAHRVGLDRTALAAWAIVAATLLNLDEVLTRN